MTRDENEAYCLERLGIGNARGEVGARIRSVSPALNQEELLSLPLSRGRFLVVDLETTGMRADKAKIIEVGAVEVDGFTIGRELGSLVFPGVSIPPFIKSLTGIDTSMVVGAPRIDEVLPLVERMLKGRVLVAHNASFDMSFLSTAWRQVFDEELDAPVLCTVKLSRRANPELESHNLDSLAKHLRIRPESHGMRSRHRALGDARITAAALVKMTGELEREGMESVGRLLKFQSSRRPKPKR